jgi:MSHA biogenesis protein MshE
MLAIVSELERLVAARRRSTSPRHSGRLLGNLLVARGFITRPDLEQALATQSRCGGRLGDIVVELGYISEHALLELLAEQLRIDVLDINRRTLDPEIGRRLAEGDARRLAAVPLRRVNIAIEVAVADPTRPDLVTQLTQLLLAPVCLYLTTPAIIDELIDNIHHRNRSDG